MTHAPILAELGLVLDGAPDLPLRLAELLLAPRVLLYGQGRAGLALRGLAMRLAQMGRDAHWLADTAPPPLRPGDLFLANASRGDLPTTVALLHRARALGAQAAVLTGVTSGPAIDAADAVLHLPAQTWDGNSVLPMGGQYELALWILGDMAAEALAKRLAIKRSRWIEGHGNMG